MDLLDLVIVPLILFGCRGLYWGVGWGIGAVGLIIAAAFPWSRTMRAARAIQA
jgi:hypothetical protein